MWDYAVSGENNRTQVIYWTKHQSLYEGSPKHVGRDQNCAVEAHTLIDLW